MKGSVFFVLGAAALLWWWSVQAGGTASVEDARKFLSQHIRQSFVASGKAGRQMPASELARRLEALATAPVAVGTRDGVPVAVFTVGGNQVSVRLAPSLAVL